MATVTKPTNSTSAVGLPITTAQIKRIMHNCSYQVDIKNEWVQWVTKDNNCTSLKSLTQQQATQIISAQEGTATKTLPADNWAFFDKTNPKHKVILSLLHQLQWVTHSEKWGEVPNLERLSKFLKSDKSPVKKPLKQMTNDELEKIIKALSQITKHVYQSKPRKH